jgi:hypothetical protein
MVTKAATISGGTIMSHGSQKKYNVNGEMVIYDYNAGGTGRRSSSFTFTVGSATPYAQIGLQAWGAADGSGNQKEATCTIHSLTIT